MTVAAFTFTPRWRPLVEIGTGDTRTPVGVGVWGSSMWGDPGATWNGFEPIWRDVSCYVQEVNTDTGRDWSIDRFTPGVCDLTATNADGWATADTEPATTVRPGRQLRVSIVDNTTGAVNPLFRGFVDSITPSFTGDDPDTVHLHVIDALGELGLYQPAATVDPPIGAGDSGDARFRRILARYGWPASLVGAVDPSGVPMAGLDWSQQFADELGITADSEGGAIIAGRDGKLVFRARDWMTWPAGTSPLWSIGNAEGDVCPTGFELSDDRAHIANQISYSRAADDAVPQLAVDAASQSKYGVLPASRGDLICQSDAQVLTLAQRTVEVKAPGGERVQAATLSAATDPARIVPILLAADVTASPPILADLHVERPDGTRVDQQGLLQRVSHAFTSSQWTCRLGFDRAEPYVSNVARWGVGHWGVDVWGSATREVAA